MLFGTIWLKEHLDAFFNISFIVLIFVASVSNICKAQQGGKPIAKQGSHPQYTVGGGYVSGVLPFHRGLRHREYFP